MRCWPPAVPFTNLDTGEPLSAVRSRVVSANAYLGARPIVEALRAGRFDRHHRPRGRRLADAGAGRA